MYANRRVMGSDGKCFGRASQPLCGRLGYSGPSFPWEKHSSSVFQLLSDPLTWDGLVGLYIQQLLMDLHSSCKDAGFF